jgi:hypothetical protein
VPVPIFCFGDRVRFRNGRERNRGFGRPGKGLEVMGRMGVISIFGFYASVVTWLNECFILKEYPEETGPMTLRC